MMQPQWPPMTDASGFGRTAANSTNAMLALVRVLVWGCLAPLIVEALPAAPRQLSSAPQLSRTSPACVGTRVTTTKQYQWQEGSDQPTKTKCYSCDQWQPLGPQPWIAVAPCQLTSNHATIGCIVQHHGMAATHRGTINSCNPVRGCKPILYRYETSAVGNMTQKSSQGLSKQSEDS
jgi:hypothetical protein